eukprot:scaffold122142_cov21-Tisochrysis_lutea.AAC.1
MSHGPCRLSQAPHHQGQHGPHGRVVYGTVVLLSSVFSRVFGSCVFQASLSAMSSACATSLRLPPSASLPLPSSVK